MERSELILKEDHMKGRINSQLGSINISEDVISTIAGSAAVECFGVVGMAAVSVKDGFAKMLKRDSLQKGIEVSGICGIGTLRRLLADMTGRTY